ncbi:MAG TPA: hypothetical protein VFH01_12870 [Pyrinomonadaceae bacterium]|nr:hypothetical protein [Pyrinomonadaceae bacterium]
MKRLAVRFGIALITFLIGLAIASVGLRREPVRSMRLLSGPPCTSGIVSVEEQAQAPLRISISDTACRHSHSANVQFVVENVDSRSIVSYEIRSRMKYDGLVDDGLAVSTAGVEHFQPHETQSGFIGGGVLNVGQLKGFQLTVWSVVFADGTKWTRESRR